MFLDRNINLNNLLRQKSFFFFGARGTGKTMLIKKQLDKKVMIIDLLKADYFLHLHENPHDLENMIESSHKIWIVIDEVQKIPILLDEVHRLIEKTELHFLLTGSSARKLKRESANMLAGRAWQANFYPLTFLEIPNFDLDKYLMFGGLPAVYLSKDPEEQLDAYINTYLKEEIQIEASIRKLPNFIRFLKVAALCNTQVINYSKVASDVGLSVSTVKEHFIILQDTLLGYIIEPWRESKKRKSIETPKFYFFDIGVVHGIRRTKYIDPNSDVFGMSFEQFIFQELMAYVSYLRKKDTICFWRAKSKQEVDFIIGDHTAIEVKASKKIQKTDLKGLFALKEENIIQKFYLVSFDTVDRVIDRINILFWRSFLQQLWNNK